MFVRFALGAAILALMVGSAWSAQVKKFKWVLGAGENSRVWRSPVRENLSPVRGVHCIADQGPDNLLAGLQPWLEPGGGNRLIAKLVAMCSHYRAEDGIYKNIGPFRNSLIYEAAYDGSPGPTYVDINSDNTAVPAGVRLYLDSKHEVVRAVAMLEVSNKGNVLGDYAHPTVTSPRPNYQDLGETHDLNCEPQRVLVGLHVKYDTRNGHLREVTAACRELRRVEDGYVAPDPKQKPSR